MSGPDVDRPVHPHHSVRNTASHHAGTRGVHLDNLSDMNKIAMAHHISSRNCGRRTVTAISTSVRVSTFVSCSTPSGARYRRRISEISLVVVTLWLRITVVVIPNAIWLFNRILCCAALILFLVVFIHALALLFALTAVLGILIAFAYSGRFLCTFARLWLRRGRGGGHIGRVIHLSISGHAGCYHGLKLSRRVSGSNESGTLYRLEVFFEGIEGGLQD